MKTSIHQRPVKSFLVIFFLLNLVCVPVFSGVTLPPPAADNTEKLPDIIVIHHPQIDKSEKEALLILPGFGDNKKRRKAQQAYFGNTEYDLYIPDYKDRKSIESTVEKLHLFYEKQALGKYKKVHVFSYILGSWVLNKFILQHGKGNIATIVYDRSPLQERAPLVIVDRIALIGRILKGKVLKELSKTPYPPIPKQGISIGILLESKATKLIKIFKKKALSYGPVHWDAEHLNQAYDDLTYTRLNHDELYSRFDVVGEEILHFIKTGSFTKDARRIPYDWDPFEKYKE